MKNLRRTIFLLAVCACMIIPFVGCDTYQNSENCGGIVKSYACIGETDIKIPFSDNEYYTAVQIEVAFRENSNKAYPYIIVVESFFEDYNCSTVEELLASEGFTESYANATVLKAENGKAILEINKEFVSNASIYFYDSVDEANHVVKIEDLDLTNYIGYFNYN